MDLDPVNLTDWAVPLRTSAELTVLHPEEERDDREDDH